MVEGEERGFVSWRQRLEEGSPRCPQVMEALSAHALTQVEREMDVQRQLLGRRKVDALHDAVVAHFEIVRAQAADDLSAIVHGDVDANGGDRGGKGRLLAEDHDAEHRREPSDQERRQAAP